MGSFFITAKIQRSMYKEIANRLVEIIDERNTTKYKIAKATGISATTIGNYCKAKTKPDNAKLKLIADHLGVSFPWLHNGEEPKYILQEQEGLYSTTNGSQKQVSEKFLQILENLTESIRDKDKQIMELLHKIPNAKS